MDIFEIQSKMLHESIKCINPFILDLKGCKGSNLMQDINSE